MNLVISPTHNPLAQLSIAGATLRDHFRTSWARVAPRQGDGTLVVDDDVWFGVAALKRLRGILSSADGAVTIVDRDNADVIARFHYLDPSGAAPPAADLEFDARDLDGQQSPMRVRDFVDVSAVESAILYERAVAAMRAGVWMRDPRSVAIRGELTCGMNVQVDVHVIIEGKVTLGDGVTIGANCILRDSTIGAGTSVNPFTIIDGAEVGAHTFVGPYGRLRPGAKVGDHVQLGNFVEIKNSIIGDKSRINHHAFVGDATLGESVTLGAGTITCNHDGMRTQRTEIGTNAYVGSGTELVAPIKVGENALIGAGSTITKNVPPDQLTVARAPQKSLPRRKKSSE